MSSERLEAYEEELKELLKELQSTVSYQLPTKDGGKTTHLPWIYYSSMFLRMHSVYGCDHVTCVLPPIRGQKKNIKNSGKKVKGRRNTGVFVYNVASSLALFHTYIKREGI